MRVRSGLALVGPSPRPLACCALHVQLFVKEREYVTVAVGVSVWLKDLSKADNKVVYEMARAFSEEGCEVHNDFSSQVQGNGEAVSPSKAKAAARVDVPASADLSVAVSLQDAKPLVEKLLQVFVKKHRWEDNSSQSLMKHHTLGVCG